LATTVRYYIHDLTLTANYHLFVF